MRMSPTLAAALAAVACLASSLHVTAQSSPDRAAPAGKLQLRVSDTTAVALDRETRIVYRFQFPRRSRLAASSRFTAERLDALRQVVASPPRLIDPTDVDVDASGRIYVADAGARTISYIGSRDELVTIYRGPEISNPIAIAAGGGRLYVLDDERRRIVSLTEGRAAPAVEYVFESGFRPAKLFWSAGTLWAVDARGSTVLRLFASNAIAQQSESGGRSLRPGESLTFRQMIAASSMCVGHDLLLALDPSKRRIVAYSALDGSPSPIDYTWIVKQPVAIAIGDGDIYLADVGGETLFRVPALVPVTAYFEAGVPSENTVAFYSYLYTRHLLPLRSYKLLEGDAIATVVNQLNLLPGPFTGSFEDLFCQANRTFCVKGKIPSTYHGGRTVQLPDVATTRYVGRRAQTLPIDPKRDAALMKQRVPGTVEGVSRFYAPITSLQDEALRAIIRDLNYTYGGSNLLKETSGSFVVPVDALRIRALVPKQELDDQASELNALVSRNVKLVPTLESSSGASLAPAEPTQDIQLPPKAAPKPDPLCEDYDTKTYNRVYELISFCIPKGVDTVSIAIIDNRFYPAHVEFQDRQAHSRLTPMNVETPNLTRHPESDATSMNFDVDVDHGTHVAGLIAAADAAGEMSGTHPRIRLYAADASKANDLLSTFTALNIVNISLGRNKRDASVIGSTPEEKTLYSLVADPNYRRILFVISAGNEGVEVAAGSLASLGAQSNVIVVGASTWANIPSMLGKSNFGKNYVHILAPGDAIKSSLYGGGYGIASGTSQAAAFVSGTAALLRSGVGRAWAPWQIKERILSTADLWLHGNADSGKVFAGMLNMKRALMDADHTVVTMDADSTVLKGTIAALDKEKSIMIRVNGRQVPIRYGDLRRFVKNSDGTRSILYSSLPDPSDDRRLLVRLQDVSADRIAPADPRGSLDFTLELPDGTTRAVQLLDLRDFVNVVF